MVKRIKPSEAVEKARERAKGKTRLRVRGKESLAKVRKPEKMRKELEFIKRAFKRKDYLGLSGLLESRFPSVRGETVKALEQLSTVLSKPARVEVVKALTERLAKESHSQLQKKIVHAVNVFVKLLSS